MAGNSSQHDEELISAVSSVIERNLGGSALWRYILDYSMVTDMLISGKLKLPLSVQLTTGANEFTATKREYWESTLRYWQIKRALFVSFNPAGQFGNSHQLAGLLLQKGDDLPSDCCSVCDV